MTYDFKALSSLDFELLVRDLLQAEWGIKLESFKSGRDSGIDLRYSQDPNSALIIQCKHYSNFSNLFNNLKKEKKKVNNLNPNRYILATSLACTPPQKDKIRDLFSPYCNSTTNDVFCADDLNNLLNKHSKIEKQHFKLWLTSTNIMESVLHSEVFCQSETEVTRIQKKIHTYVQSQNFIESQEILAKHHYCIISGIPGIGKTTLAEMLLIYYLSQGFEIIKISNDIEEGYKIINKAKKQIFYYDDFLGQTTLMDKLNKNEDQRLLQFIQLCESSKTTLFILTTREYILNQAKLHYERLSASDFDLNKCIIDLSSYSNRARAKILFNHLYYSRVPQSYLYALIESKKYKEIINHKNYSPRIIEWMTEKHRVERIQVEEYTSEFINNLNNPVRLWEHAYTRQITETSQYLLLCLTTLPAVVSLDNLEKAFIAIYEPSQKSQQHEIHKSFRHSLKELEGNFISIDKKINYMYVRFHNPSIRDFMESYILENSETMTFLYINCIYFDQLYALSKFAKERKHLIKHFVSATTSRFYAENCVSYGVYNFEHKNNKHFLSLSIESRLAFLINTNIEDKELSDFINVVVEKVVENVRQDNVGKHNLLSLIKVVAPIKNTLGNAAIHLVDESKKYFMRSLKSVDDFDLATDFFAAFDNLYPESIIDLSNNLEDNIDEFVNDLLCLVQESDSSSNYIEEQLSKIKAVADYLNVDIPDTDEIENFLQELENKRIEQYEPDLYDDDFDDEKDISEKEIENIFDLLLESGVGENTV